MTTNNLPPLFRGVAHADKYQSGNPISRFLVNNFMSAIRTMALGTGNKDVHEVGCGEGHILGVLAGAGLTVRGCDISASSLAVAKEESLRANLQIPLENKSIYDLDEAVDSADLVICCEVLEHLTEPEKAMENLARIARRDLIVSVPNEPLWHLMNMARGAYLHALGNTPGHYQHWTKKQFVAFVSQYADVVSVRSPLPWTIVHCRPKKKAS